MKTEDMKPVVRLERDTYMAEVYETPRGVLVWWTDYVINEWSEVHESLPLALARLAVLEYSVTTEHGGFTEATPEAFLEPAQVWLAARGGGS